MRLQAHLCDRRINLQCRMCARARERAIRAGFISSRARGVVSVYTQRSSLCPVKLPGNNYIGHVRRGEQSIVVVSRRLAFNRTTKPRTVARRPVCALALLLQEYGETTAFARDRRGIIRYRLYKRQRQDIIFLRYPRHKSQSARLCVYDLSPLLDENASAISNAVCNFIRLFFIVATERARAHARNAL